MSNARFEHVNVTVPNPDATAQMLVELFDWRIRWSGGAIHGGRSVHVGTDDAYIALYNPPRYEPKVMDSYSTRMGTNHIGLVVQDLDAAEARIQAAGYKTYSHDDYEPGRRFYFRDSEGIEFEIVSYS